MRLILISLIFIASCCGPRVYYPVEHRPLPPQEFPEHYDVQERIYIYR